MVMMFYHGTRKYTNPKQNDLPILNFPMPDIREREIFLLNTTLPSKTPREHTRSYRKRTHLPEYFTNSSVNLKCPMYPSKLF